MNSSFASGTGTEADRLLGIYLNDHLVGSAMGIRLARRIAANQRASRNGYGLTDIAREIAEDRASLLALMRRLGIRPKRVRAWTIGTAGERLGRLKLNGYVLRRSPLSNVIEIEAMRLGVLGKLSLWNALLAAEPEARGISVAELEQLAERARRQAEALELLRLASVAETLTGPGSRAGTPASVSTGAHRTADSMTT